MAVHACTSAAGAPAPFWGYFLPSFCVPLHSHRPRRNVFAMLSSNLDVSPPTETKTSLKQSAFPFSPPEAASVRGRRQVCVLLPGGERAGGPWRETAPVGSRLPCPVECQRRLCLIRAPDCARGSCHTDDQSGSQNPLSCLQPSKSSSSRVWMACCVRTALDTLHVSVSL